MNEIELTEKLKDEYVKDVVGEKKYRTLEDALQEALDNTTISSPGEPDRPQEPGDQDVEWI